MAVLRFLASVLLLVAVIALVADATPTIDGARPFQSTTLDRHWRDFAPASQQAAKAAISRTAGARVWNALATYPLQVPTWVAFAALGLLAGYAGRRRRGVKVFAN